MRDREVILVEYEGYTAAWSDALKRHGPEFDVRAWPDWGTDGAGDYAVVWAPPAGCLAERTRLRAIFSVGAGVDQLMRDPTLPQSVPLTRMVDTLLAKGMVEFAVMAALMLFRDMPHYLAQQRNALWKPLPQRTASECTVGVMGLGELGSAVLDGLRSYGFRLRGWSRSQRSIAGIETFDSAGLHDFLATTNILISILPGTPHTRGLLNYDTMGRLPRGASIANLGRGSLIDIDGLIARLDEDHLAAAFLDVAPEEPVASHSPLWCHPKIVLTPHIAAATLPDHAAQNIIHDIRALADGRPLIHEVVRDRGY